MEIVVEINSDEQHLIETSDHLEKKIQTCKIEYRFDVFLFGMSLIMIGKHKDTKYARKKIIGGKTSVLRMKMV